MGQHEEARAATKRAIALNPDARRGRRPTWRSTATRTNGIERRGGSRWPTDAPRRSPSGGALAHFNLGLAFRQKGYYAEALREYRLALDAGEDRRLTLQAMAEVHLLRRDLAGALELYDALVEEYADSPKLWNERGVCLHQAGPARRGSRPTSAPSALDAATRSPGTTSASSGPATRAPARRDGRVPRGARGAAGRCSRPRLNLGAAPLPAAPAPAGARGVSAGAGRAARQRGRRGTASGLVLMELHAVRGRAQRLRPRGGRRPRLRRGALQPELHR